MALVDYHNTGQDSTYAIYGINWYMQSFTASSSYTLASVKLLMYRIGSPSTVDVSIRATDGSGKPTGADLATGSYNGNLLTTDSAGEWVEFTLSSGVSLTSGVKYAIVISAPSGSTPSNYLRILTDTSSGYAGGGAAWSGDSGVTWGAVSGSVDIMFETYSSGPTVYAEGTLSVTGAGSVSLASETHAWDGGILVAVGVGLSVLASEVATYKSMWPNARGSDYDPDLYWDEETETWSSASVIGPGAFQSYAIFVGEEGEVYFGAS